jgi:hypothetical protein
MASLDGTFKAGTLTVDGFDYDIEFTIRSHGKGTVHGSPLRGRNVTPCCGIYPLELPRDSRMTNDIGLINCDGSR